MFISTVEAVTPSSRFNSTAEEVIYYALDRNIKINPLYFYGCSRVGCFPCINANHGEMQVIVNNFPDTIKKIKEAVYNPDSGLYARLRELEQWKESQAKVQWTIITTVIGLVAATLYKMIIST